MKVFLINVSENWHGRVYVEYPHHTIITSRGWPFEQVCALPVLLVKRAPGGFCYRRSCWSTELLAIKTNEIAKCQLPAETIHHWLPATGRVWQHTAPHGAYVTRRKKMAAIHDALEKYGVEHPVFYEDEVDNYIIRKGRETIRWLKVKPKFRVIYPPWVNHLERLWLALHDAITRNHPCRSMWQLWKRVRQFLKTASPFPGGKHTLAKV